MLLRWTCSINDYAGPTLKLPSASTSLLLPVKHRWWPHMLALSGNSETRYFSHSAAERRFFPNLWSHLFKELQQETLNRAHICLNDLNNDRFHIHPFQLKSFSLSGFIDTDLENLPSLAFFVWRIHWSPVTVSHAA